MFAQHLKTFCLALITLVFIRTADAETADKHLQCEDTIYKIQTSMFQIEAIEIVNKKERQFCATDEPELVLVEKNQRNAELWCVKYFLITPETRPYFKTSKMLNFQSNRLYDAEYIFYDGDWHGTKRRTIACSTLVRN